MPRIKTTPMVRAALWALRIYLLVLLGLIALKFARVYTRHQRNAAAPAASGQAEGADKGGGGAGTHAP